VRPEDSLILQGIVIEQHPQQSQVKVELWAENQNGEKVATAQAVIVLPMAPDKPISKKSQESGLYISAVPEKSNKPENVIAQKTEEIHQNITNILAEAAEVGNKLKEEISKKIDAVKEAAQKDDKKAIAEAAPKAKAAPAKETVKKDDKKAKAAVAPKAAQAKEVAKKDDKKAKAAVAPKAAPAKEAAKKDDKKAKAAVAPKAAPAKEAAKKDDKKAKAEAVSKAPAKAPATKAPAKKEQGKGKK
jgi:hypothetical protein